MSPLPVKQAAKLADSMAKSGLSGSIAMGKPPSSDEEDGEDMPEQEGSEMDACVSDLADAIMAGDKAGLVSALHALVDCIQHEDESQDQQME